MRIALVVYGNLNQVSGGFIYDRELVRALVGLGHAVDVIGLPWVGYARAVAGAWGGGTKSEAPSQSEPAYDAVIEDELVHPSVVGRRRGRAGLPIGRTVVALVHNLGSGQPGARLRGLRTSVERRYLAGVDGVIAVCERTLADVRALLGKATTEGAAAVPWLVAHPGRDHVTPLTTEADVEARSRGPGPLRLLHAAGVVPGKGLLRLVEAVAAAGAGANADDGTLVTLDVVGSLDDHRHVRAVEARIADLGLASRVRLHGRLAGPRLHEAFRQAQVFALPSDREAYSLACLEAMGYGLPVLATSNGGLAELLGEREPKPGQLLVPSDLAGWTDSLARMARDRATVIAMGRAALARYREHAMWTEVAARVTHFLLDRWPPELAESGSPRGGGR